MWNNNTIEDEIQRNSLEYGVSVNTDRSIPDAKSGLKPVARRIIYDAYEKGFTSNKGHVKCASIVGDTIARFHPHGDTSVYDAMVRLSQSWVMRYPLIDFHGNNGNILGDGAAAYRYTEARLAKISEDGLLAGLKKKNVPFTPTFDERDEEPTTFPAIFPNLLCNPNEGIGWAIGCSWAPHNLKEVSQAILDYLDGKEPMLPGPDFPTGGIIINKQDIPKIMATGKGSVKVRGKYKIEKNNIVFYEIPYGTRVESLMEEIGKACEEGKITDVADIRNETSKKAGLRLVIQVEKDANIDKVVNQLFLKSNLQNSFSYNQVALINKTPTELNLKGAIEVYVKHNIECIIREAKFDLEKASARLEIVNGLIKALEDIDNIIILIKESASAVAAKQNLVDKYSFSEPQAKAIVDMKLGRLAGLEKIELNNERIDLLTDIEDLNALVSDEDKQKQELINRLITFTAKYGDDRRTELAQIEVPKAEKEVVVVEPEDCVVIINSKHQVKRIAKKSFKAQKRNSVGIKTAGDIVAFTASTNTQDTLMVFTSKGKMYRVLVDNIPEGTNTSTGVPISSLIEFENNEVPMAFTTLTRDTDKQFIFFATKNGIIKKVPLSEYDKMKRTGIIAINFKEGDSLAAVTFVNQEDVMLITKKGMSIRFDSTEVPISSRIAQGVKGISLNEGDQVIAALPISNPAGSLAIVIKSGLGKRVSLDELQKQKRAGRGVKISQNQEVIGAAIVMEDEKIYISGNEHSICISASELPMLSRISQGNVLLKNDKEIVSIVKI
jgi:DNA gyrase subunit A